MKTLAHLWADVQACFYRNTYCKPANTVTGVTKVENEMFFSSYLTFRCKCFNVIFGFVWVVEWLEVGVYKLN